MNKCVYRDKVISAAEFAAKFETETELRKNAQELYCCDPDCQSPVIFKHGVKRVAHFAHKASNVHCNYSAYIEKMPVLIRQIHQELLKRLRQAAEQTKYTVDFDVSLPCEYKHIMNIALYGATKYAIDIMQSNKTVCYLDKLYDTYKIMGFTAFPVIIADVMGHFNDNTDVYYTVRYWLHKSAVHTVLVYNTNEKAYYLCRLSLEQSNKTVNNVYVEKCMLEMLLLGKNGITTVAFEKNFAEWEKKTFAKETFARAELNESAMELKNYDCLSEDYIAKRLVVLPDMRQIAVNIDWYDTLYTKLVYVDVDRRDSRKRVEVPIAYITVPKSRRWLGQMTSEMVINEVFSALCGDVTSVRKLINLLRDPHPNEIDTFVKICNYIAEIPLNNNVVVINRILHQIIEQISG